MTLFERRLIRVGTALLVTATVGCGGEEVRASADALVRVTQLPAGTDSATVLRTAPRPPNFRKHEGDTSLWTWEPERVEVYFVEGKLHYARVAN